MPFVVTDACIKDFVCVAECPVTAIAPAPGDATAGSVTQVFIDPNLCIECGSFAAKNQAYFQQIGAAQPAMESTAR